MGQRTLIDASNGAHPRLLDGSTLPDLPHPPAGFGPSVIQQPEHERLIERSWTAMRGDWPRLLLLTGSPADLTRDFPPYGEIVRQFRLGGTVATAYESGDAGSPGFAVQWTPNAQQTIRLQLDGDPSRAWTLSDAIRLSRSVTGYRSTPAEQPLPPTKTPGTVAATYSSTDGPVTRVPNLLKSSGVWVGVNCRGTGHVAVTLRGRTFTWACSTRPSAHVAESTGRPDETFFVTVVADPGVRWTVTLARASLDGS
jgi:hypothetical protein